ncbi:MAG: chemotaxis protein CheW [Rubrivivax sp.]|jgi:purine-binding chemotaxis protein CheW|nr:chemotaxis protein CheW [Rubrivivax sp.]
MMDTAIAAPTGTPPSQADGPAGGGRASLLRMSVGGEPLAVPIAEVREILELARLTPVPRTPGFVCGVMNLRGAVVPVLDLSARLGGPPATRGRRSCIVVAEARAEDDAQAAPRAVVGLLVDAVSEVFDVAEPALEAVPALGTRVEPRFLSGMARAHGQVLGVLRLQAVLAASELGALIAAHQGHGAR